MPYEDSSATASRPPQPGKKYFTVEEANRALPYVARVTDDIARHYRTVIDLRRQVEQAGEDDDAAPRREYEKAMDQLNDLIDELQQVGVELKDFEQGLIDFPAVYQDREIYLCWKRGEDKIVAWHEIDAGYAGRQDVGVLEESDE